MRNAQSHAVVEAKTAQESQSKCTEDAGGTNPVSLYPSNSSQAQPSTKLAM